MPTSTCQTSVVCRTRALTPARRSRGLASAMLFLATIASCTETYDVGSDPPHGLLPVDERNPIVLFNDSQYDNWQGEYAVLLANGGGPRLAGIVVNTSPNATSIEDNVSARRALVAAARNSGMRNIPDPISSIGSPLVRPPDGAIEATVPNRSEGALFIISESARISLPYRPLVVVTGGRLTDVADAYLIDPTVVDRVVIVSMLGSLTASGAVMGPPNGEMDPWAETIVTFRFRYIQISASYDQLTDVPTSRLPELPNNAFGTWIAGRRSEIWDLPQAADQVAVAAVGIPSFVVAVARASASGPVPAGATTGPTLVNDPNGPLWLVREVAGSAATKRFWEILLNPETYGP